MKKIKKTYQKIVAGDELKARIVDNVLNKAAPEQAGMDDALKQVAIAGRPCITRRRKFNLTRILAAAASLLIVLTLVMQPWMRSGYTPPEIPDPGGNSGGNVITDPGGNPGSVAIGGGIIDPSYTDLSPKSMSPVTLSREDLVSALYTDGSEDRDPPPVEDEDESGPGGAGKDDYAKTNVQHEGIDEGDIIKVDNGFIYSLSQEGLVVVSVSDIMDVTCKIKYNNFYPDEMFIFGDRLIVIGGQYTQYYYNQSSGDDWYDCDMVPQYEYRSSTRVIVYDLNDRVNVVKLCEYDITGYFMTSRLIGNKLIWAVSYNFNRWDKNGLFPKINGEDMAAENIYLYDNGPDYYYKSYTVIASLNLDSLKANATAHLGLYGISYFSKDNVYFFNNGYAYNNESDEFSYYYYYTVIVKINLNSLMYAASTKLNGHLYDRYWADEYQNNLRMVTHYYESKYYNWGGSTWMRHTNLFVLDSNLNTIGTIVDIASGENIYSVRFKGYEGSIVTFLQIDPLFKLDLSDPKNPAISKGLKEEGVNDYLQYLSDDVILGLGRGAGLEGMKVALYDNTGADAVNMKSIDIGKGRLSSEALWNPKAILNDPAKNMFSFAATDYGPYSYNSGYLLYSQGLHVFEYNLNASSNNDKLIFKGLLSNISPNKTYKDWYDYYDDYFAYVKRGARIGNKIYTISERYICSYDINSLDLIQKLQISNIHYHHMNETQVTTPATCDANGFIKYYCTYENCDYSERHILWTSGCDWDAWAVTIQPTQTTSGTETRICKRDYLHTETRKIAIGGLVISAINDNSEYYIFDHSGTNGTVIIPVFVDGLPVTGIAPYTFYSSIIENITFASGSKVQSIGNYAFAYSHSLKSITLPDSVIKIGNYAFYDCFELNSITISSNVTEIGNNAFYGCNIKNITLPDSLIQIGNYAFGNCRSLDKIEIPVGVTYIGSSAFSYCINLRSVTIKGNLRYIGSSAFSNCTSLSKIELNSGLTEISNSAFYNCTSLSSIVIPDSVTIIGAYAFYNCNRLSNINIPYGVMQINGNAFSNCANLKELTIPDSVTYIGSGTFSGCTNLKEITIPDRVTYIGDSTFYDCYRLTKINVPSGITYIGNYAFYNCGALTEITIPSGVKYIGNYAFYKCTGIKEITIPSGVAQICYGVFFGWKASQTIYIKGHMQKPMGWFMDWNEQCSATIVWDS